MQPTAEPHGLTSPLPDEPDVHLIVRIRGHQLHYAACLTAALVFLQDESIHRCADAVALASGATDQLPRMPCERLYVER
ncbi:hypothetical protein [Nocardia araoensis]|uniref:hypothetical protein n=1 Tax=Nocardia araoensis TaxID=228600 RepID=UPI0002DBAB59|nr:hypothetical protein [Nocardia araoensis]